MSRPAGSRDTLALFQHLMLLTEAHEVAQLRMPLWMPLFENVGALDGVHDDQGQMPVRNLKALLSSARTLTGKEHSRRISRRSLRLIRTSQPTRPAP